MARARLIFYSLVLAALAAVFVFRAEIYDYFRPAIETKLREFEKAATESIVGEIQKQFEFEPKIETPPPLRVEPEKAPDTQTEPPALSGVEEPAPSNTEGLSTPGIINWTNVRRVQNGPGPLAENQQLDEAARARLKDMFEKQYFAHYSPSGEGAADAAKAAGYQYLELGENLALGSFQSDAGVVDAWMASPGHRANILNGKYTEIGVAAEGGLFEGKMTWIAVQIFGRPLALCPSPSAPLKAEAESLSSQLAAMQEELEARHAEIESMNPHTPAYQKKAEEYNALVVQYNSKVTELKTTAADYNLQVAEFNECIR